MKYSVIMPGNKSNTVLTDITLSKVFPSLPGGSSRKLKHRSARPGFDLVNPERKITSLLQYSCQEILGEGTCGLQSSADTTK